MIIAVGAVKGSCGVTSTALVLAAAAAEYGPAWLVEADPSGGSLVGSCPTLSPAPGLEQLGFDRVSVTADVLGDLAQPLGAAAVLTLPPDPYRAWVTVTQPRSPWRDALRQLTGTVLIDIGRIYPDTPAWPLASLADRVLLVTAPTPMGLAATAAWQDQGGRVTARGDALPAQDIDLVVALPPARAYRAGMVFAPAELPAQLGTRLAGMLPWDAVALENLQRGADLRHRSVAGSSLTQAARALVAELGARSQRQPDGARV